MIILKKIQFKEELIRVQKILDKSPKYFINVDGEVAQNNSSVETWEALPPKTDRSQKNLFIIESDEIDIGVIDLIIGYPNTNTAFIGLLLLDESFQKRNLGKCSYLELEKFIFLNTLCNKIRLAIVDSNHVNLFWEKMGFKFTGETKPHEGIKLKSTKRLMEKYIR